MRRIFSHLLDLAFLGAPWLAYLGLFASPTGGNWIGGLAVATAVTMYASAGTTLLLIVAVAVFLMRGRTFGMAVTGLVALQGRRWLAFVLTPLLLILTSAVVFLAISTLAKSRGEGDDVTTVVLLAILTALALNFVFLCGSRRRTMTDFVTGLRVVRDPVLPVLQSSLHRGPNIIDWLIAAGIGVPIVFALGLPSLGAALGNLAGLLALGALELVLWKKTGATLGMRAVARQNLTEATGFDPSASPPTRPQ
jgi:hypothetical protein